MRRRFLICFCSAALCLTALFAGIVWAVDPWYHYHEPIAGLPLCLRDGRYQNYGIAKHMEYDTLLMGTSVTANMHIDAMNQLISGKALKLIVQGGYFSDFYRPLDVALATHDLKEIYWGIDSNCLRRLDQDNPWQEPTYLFDNNPLNDVEYLLNKEMFFWDLTAVLERAQVGDDQDERTGGYTWEEKQVPFEKEFVLSIYQRPETSSAAELPSDALFPAAQENLTNILSRVEANPEITFTFYLPPYSILFWDQTIRTGEFEATLAMQRLVLETLVSRPNVRVFYFMDDTALITNLDNYCDHIHYSPAVCQSLLETMVQGTPMTEEEIGPRLDCFRDFLLSYDYDGVWQTE